MSDQLPKGEIWLDQLHWTYPVQNVTEPMPLDTQTGLVKHQCPVHLQLNESKVRLSPSGDFD